MAATEAAGIARVASYQLEDLVETGRLVLLLEAFEPRPVPVNLMYVGQGQTTAQVAGVHRLCCAETAGEAGRFAAGSSTDAATACQAWSSFQGTLTSACTGARVDGGRA